jgi:amyloid beta A4 protein
MNFFTAITGLVLICSTLSTYVDVFETTNGHEPQVAINCGNIPFYIDLKTGAWVADSEGKTKCDKRKKQVLRYCKKKYPSLNITNIVEGSEKVNFNNWCKPGHAQCDEGKEVIPYRCLVKEYEADALMVPSGCKFDHIHHDDMCLSLVQWKKQASTSCETKYHMLLKSHGILLPCDVDMFSGVEYVCCPKKTKKNKVHKVVKIALETEKVALETAKVADLQHAIQSFKKHLPEETKGCDRSIYSKKQVELEDRHRDQIAAVVDEWDETEKVYNKLKIKDPAAAEEKMKRTLEVFRETLAALEQESKAEKSRLRTEHAQCITNEINKDKRDAMLAYLNAIKEEPVDSDKILKTVRKFIQVCEHDRVHNLHHFEHLRNRNPKEAESVRFQLLNHLKDLNKVVNDSMALLNYLPDISEKFGITGPIEGVMLKPRLTMEHKSDNHSVHDHSRIKEILDKHDDKVKTQKIDVRAPATPLMVEEEKEPIDKDSTKLESLETIDDKKGRKEIKDLLRKNLKEERRQILDLNRRTADHNEEVSRSPFAFNAIMGLSCGVLVIMMLLVVAMVVRRRRLFKPHVVIADNNDDGENNDREHLVQMQKNGFENPTYKFFYY